MKNSIKRLKLIVLLVLSAILLMTIESYAASVDVELVKMDSDYIIYINNMEDKAFKFAFTNDKALTESTAATELNFIQNWEDTNGTNVACLEKDTELDLSKPIYMWIQKENETYSVQLELEKAISKEELEELESLTKIIAIDTEQTTTTVTSEDGVAKAETIGQINITDTNSDEYKYQLIKLDGTETKTAKKLIELVDTLKSTYSSMSMYNKVQFIKQINEVYDTLQKESKWTDVKDRVIYQPKDSVEGDRYLVLLQQLSDGKVIKNDIQFLVCTNEKEQEVVKEVKEVKRTSTLPVTYDSIILFIILAVILIIAILVIIRMRKLNAEKNRE